MKNVKLLSPALWLTGSLCHFTALALGVKSGKMSPLSAVLTSVNAALSLSIATLQFADYLADVDEEPVPAEGEDDAPEIAAEDTDAESGPEIVIDQRTTE